MTATIEISMYPLHQDYERRVLDFLDKLHQYPNVKVETNGVSTQIFGEYDTIMHLLQTEIKTVFEEQMAMFVLKIGKGELRF